MADPATMTGAGPGGAADVASALPPGVEGIPLVALVGNPNTGKSALFNRLTGGRARVGNFPGLTVEKRFGRLRGAAAPDGRPVDVIDLPGTYALDAVSADEWIVHEVLTGRSPGTRTPELVVCVVDAGNLTRNLFLASQVGQVGVPVVVALNMIDEAERKGLRVNASALAERLGVPVVCTSATRGTGIDELRRALAARPRMAEVPWPAAVTGAFGQLQHDARQAGYELTPADAARMLFGDGSELARRMGWGAAPAAAAAERARKLLTDAGLDPGRCESMLRYGWIATQLEGVVTSEPTTPSKRESVDAVLTHRVAGAAVFLAVMYVVFTSIYTFAGPLMDGIDAGFTWLSEWAGSLLSSTPMLASLVTDGVIAGVGGVVIFLPQILILFFFIALLEDSGYMARAAFLMDRLFSWCGLSGKSFVPMLSSYACAVPGVMATRTIEDPKARLTTILIAPLMSCSARLPVYVLLIGAFVEPAHGALWAGFALFALHLLGLGVAMPVAWVMNKLVLRGKGTPFVLELPPYRVPALRDVLYRMYERGREFVIRAGTVIFAMSIVIWALCYFPRSQEMVDAATSAAVAEVAAERGVAADDAAALAESDEDFAAAVDAHVSGALLEQSFMGHIGHGLQPLFAPAGFDWKITVGVVASFPAREVLISTLGIIYDLGGDVDEESAGLKETMQAAAWPDGTPVYTLPVALGVMVFFALCLQCASTVAVIGREAGARWAVFAFVYMTGLAWAGAVVVYQVGTLLQGAVA